MDNKVLNKLKENANDLSKVISEIESHGIEDNSNTTDFKPSRKERLEDALINIIALSNAIESNRMDAVDYDTIMKRMLR